MLVLLIIFMVATPMLHQGIEVALPRVEATALPMRDEDPMVLTITKDELVFIKDTPVHQHDVHQGCDVDVSKDLIVGVAELE